MSEWLSTAETAAHLRVSPRRVRAMITGGQLPAHRLLGRWAVPAKAVIDHRQRPAGRPMSETTAWTLLRHLADPATGKPLPSSMKRRMRALFDAADPTTKLTAWASRRGNPMHAWAPLAALSALARDERVIVSGGRAVTGIQPSQSLCVYVSAADLDNVIRDHGLHPHADVHRLPNISMWAVTDLTAIPRSLSNPHLAAPPVAAIDLLHECPSETHDTARRMISAAVGMAEYSTRKKPSTGPVRPTRHRPHAVVEDLQTLRGPIDSVVRLPISLDWGPNPVYDLSNDSRRRTFYERVLNEALRVDQLETFLNDKLLMDLWPHLSLARDVRPLWEKRFPELVARTTAPDQLV